MNKTLTSRRIALSALPAALALVILFLSCTVPSGRLGLVAVAGLLPAAAVISGGPVCGVLCYAGSALLAVLLLPDKGNALFYLLFFGLYPLIKFLAERLRSRPGELAIKLLFFNAVFTLFFLALQAVFLTMIPIKALPAPLLWLAGDLVFLAYDFGFTKLIAFYVRRIDAPLRKGDTKPF